VDACFGKDVGGAALAAIVNGMSGVTVTGVVAGVIQCVETKQIIRQRMVHEQTVRFHEAMGICFGRKVAEYRPEINKLDQAAWCYL
jgi:hypothetical protein